jgi:hypothetical protein
MVLGAGAMMIPGLQGFGAAGIAAGIGGLQALRTGSLKKGLMAGFGAYGGAGLAGGLTAAGAASGAGAAGAGTPDILGGIGTQPATFSGNLAQAGQGFTALPTSEAARTAFMGNAALKGSGVGGAKGLMQYGLAAAAPMMMETTTKQPEIKTDASMGQRYQFNPGMITPTPTPDVPEYGNQGQNFGKERLYFNPTYRPIDDATAKKQYGFASGGTIADMSNANNMAAYMGLDKFAEGGEVGGYTYDPKTGLYTKPGGQGATTVSPTGGISALSGVNELGVYDRDNNVHTVSPFIATEDPKDQAVRSAALDRGLTNVFSALSPVSTIAMSLLDTPFVGAIANAFGTRQDPSVATVEDAGMYAGARQTSAESGRGIPGESETQAEANNVAAGLAAAADAAAASGGGGFTNDAGGSETSGSLGFAQGGLPALAQGGISHLGDYSDGGRLLRGPGDGISDSIPAVIGKKQPARLADGEFVVPARIVSELGNGSTEAGARKLYAMMDRIQKARKKTVGKGKVAANSRSSNYLPA